MKKWMTLFLIITTSSLFVSAQSEEEEWDNYLNYYADTLAWTLRNDDTTLLNSIFDEGRFLQKILIQKDDKSIQSFNQEYAKKFKDEFNLGEIIVEAIDTGHYDFVNHYTSIEGDLHMIFRLLGLEGAFNYHDFQLEWVEADSAYRATDVYFYGNGEKISETLQIIYKNLLRGALDVEIGNTRVNKMERENNKFVEIKRLLADQKYEEAKELYYTFPEKLREQRIYKYWKIKILADLTNQEYIEAIDDYNNSYPDDPSFFFLAYNKAFLEEDWDGAMKYLNKIDISVGLDPFLDYNRGLIFYSKKDYKNAQEKFEKAKSKYDFELLYDYLLDLYISTNQNMEAIKILNDYLIDFFYAKTDLIKWVKENYANFSKTAEFLVWEKEE
jgi:hypothetical protein